MSKKYLVRREQCRFVGPMSLQEFRAGLRKMKFGLEDEVAGHCSLWTVLDNEGLVRKRYPELASIVAEELPAAWREMTGHARQMTNKEKRVKSASHRQGKSLPAPRVSSKAASAKGGGLGNLIVGTAIVIAIAAASATYWLKTREEAVPAVADIAFLAQQEDLGPFLNEMGLRIIPIAARVSKGRDKEGLWLPYLRMYAFHTNGFIENFPVKILRGNVSLAAPQECSVDSWKKRWLDSGPQVSAWILGKSSLKNPWMRSLSWDPWWIRRHPVKGWLRPQNWYEACLMSASVAIRAVSSETPMVVDGAPSSSSSSSAASELNAEVVAAVSRRLQAQLEIIQNGTTSVVPNIATISGQLTCLDLAATIPAAEACRQKQSEVALQKQEDEYAAWQLIRLSLGHASGALDPAIQAKLVASSDILLNEDSTTKLDYAIELQYWKELQVAGFKLDGVSERISAAHPEVRLLP
ncbi:MAG: hypothetical protein NTV34_03080 [Proteobacteria bacterium]|nr:hypothetical protein [Pseudomonadota bacterium]